MSQFFLHGPGSELRFDLHDGLSTVGRNPTNDVRLTLASVSSFHAEIEIDGDRVVVRDLQSTNGTRVNHELINEVEIRPGDELSFGEQRLRLDREVPVVATAVASDPDSLQQPARYQCTRCDKLWDTQDVKLLKLGRDSAELRFCPACSGRCVVADPVAAAGRPSSEPSLLNRLSQTMKISTRRRGA